MAVTSVTLKGSAVHGIDVALTDPFAPARRTLTSASVRLGRRPPKPQARGVRPLTRGDLTRYRRTLPGATNWRAQAARSLSQTLGNTQQGDCVVAAKMHAVGLWTGNAVGSPGEAVGSDAEALRTYHQIGGPGDNGLVMTDALDWMRERGIPVGGTAYKLDDYAAVDWTQADLVRASVADLLNLDIGINLPEAWTQNAVWDVTTTGIVGGHNVACLDFDDQGVYVASWGRVYLITWRAFTSRSWLEEAYAMLAPASYQPTGTLPSGFTHAQAVDAMSYLAYGHVPPDPTPVPPAPPVPPPPAPVPVGGYVVDLDWTGPGGPGSIKGTVRPAPAAGRDPDTLALDCETECLAQLLVDFVFPLEGVAVTRHGSVVTVSRLGLSPGQWEEIAAAILAIIRAILGGGSAADAPHVAFAR